MDVICISALRQASDAPMNFLRNLSLLFLRILVRTRGRRPLPSLMRPSSTSTNTLVLVRSMVNTQASVEII